MDTSGIKKDQSRRFFRTFSYGWTTAGELTSN
jgi:hypothetical protein